MQDKYESGLHKDAKFWEAVTARKNKGKKRKSRKFSSDQKDPFSILEDNHKLIPDDNDDDTADEIAFKSKYNTSNSAANNQHDMDLIKQLAQLAEDDSDDLHSPHQTAASSSSTIAPPHVNSSSTTSTSSNKNSNNVAPPSNSLASPTAKGELEALEDLEKELGLADLQLFSNEKTKVNATSEQSPAVVTSKPSTSSAAPSDSASKAIASNDIEDNLDELERYLQSLSTQK
jgi:hypothetical protein